MYQDESTMFVNGWHEEMNTITSSGERYKSIVITPCDLENHVICYETGKTDINGRKLYEGDYILFYYEETFNSGYQTGYIEWADHDEAFYVISVETGVSVRLGDLTNKENSITYIGNVEENPSLIGE